MGYIKNVMAALLGRPNAQSFDLANMSDEEISEFLRIGGAGYRSASGVSVTESTALKIAAAWRCVNLISSTIACMPTDLIERVSENERRAAEKHPLRDVLTVQPNSWQTPKEFKQMLQSHLLLRGNAYAQKVMQSGRVVALLPLHPDAVTVEKTLDGRLEYRVTRPRGEALKLQQKDVLHLRGITLDSVTGLSLLSHAREAFGISSASERASASLMNNGTFANSFLSHPNKLSLEAIRNLQASFSSEYGGAENAGKMPVLQEGMEIKTVAMTAADLQFLEQRDFQRYDIAMFFGVPPHMIGATEKGTSWGSGIEQQAIGFVTYTLNDWIVTWQEAIKRDVIPRRDWGHYDFRFFPQSLLKGDSKAQWESFTKGRQWGVYSANDVRQMLDMNPRKDADGDVYAVPPNETQGQDDGKKESSEG